LLVFAASPEQLLFETSKRGKLSPADSILRESKAKED
jgi:hypothetical protein